MVGSCLSNKKTEFVANFYLDVAKSFGGVSLQIKTDNDIEHYFMGSMHLHLSALNGNLKMNHFGIITSPQNKRNEIYCSVL